MSGNFKVSAPGKLIISGEHAVVYGYPALVAAVDRRLSISLAKGKKKIESNIPIGCGMGSSAAFAVATSAAKMFLRNKKHNLDEINKIAYKMEKKKHGNPSGVDNTISTYGGFLWYRKETEEFKTFSSLKVKTKLPKLFVINSGKPLESTKEMVSLVAEFGRKNPIKLREVLLGIEAVTRKFLQYLLNERKYQISDLIKENESLLEKLGVVSSSTVKLIREIEKTGGAAKISGAGGRKDKSGILLIYHKDSKKLQKFVREKNLELLEVKLGGEGLRIEK